LRRGHGDGGRGGLRQKGGNQHSVLPQELWERCPPPAPRAS
jgi:hypothetical protein